MAKQQQLSSESYIRTRARTLPIDACYVNVGWETARLANVVVLRRHVNGNITSAVYLVDLLCLGIKDSFYFFNQSLYEIQERFDFGNGRLWQKIDYALAHNIIYAGHDFAMDFHIEPHQDFAVTRYILEEDDDNVPLIEIETGDEEGKPHLMVRPSDTYGPVLARLKKYAGEGNYTFTIGDEPMDWNDEDEEEEDIVDDESEEEDWDEDEYLDDIGEELLDFNHVSEISTSKLLFVLTSHERAIAEEVIIKAELLVRMYHEERDETVIADEKEIIESPAYKMYEERKDKWNEAYEASKPFLSEIQDEVRNLLLRGTGDENEINNYLSLFDKYSESEIAVSSLLQAGPPAIVIKMFNELLKRFEQYSPLVQLFIAAIGLIIKNENIELYRFILSAENVEDAYPAGINIHSLHHRFFWLVKALHALNIEDEKSLWHWHNLIRMTGIGGNMKSLYAIRLEQWLREKMDLENNDIPPDTRENIDIRS